MNKSNSFEAYYNRKCLAYSVENANYSKEQIVFIGDSITDLYTLDSYYSLTLATYNRGIGGDTTEGVLKRLDVSLSSIFSRSTIKSKRIFPIFPSILLRRAFFVS